MITILGLMTGSSADGLDLCLVNFSGTDRNPDYKVVRSLEIPYPKKFQNSFRNPLELSDEDISSLHLELGKWFAVEIDKLDLDFDLIASHGQTIKHEPPHFTLQIGDPKFMAEAFKCPVIYDFRTADIERGGQGAPLIPIVDQYLLQKDHTDILAINIGGIANLTIVPSLNNPAPLLAWDTGPGNTLIDKAVRLFTRDELPYDTGGDLAAQGKVNEPLLEYLLKHRFYQLSPPRSAGQEQFGKDYFDQLITQFNPTTPNEFKDLIRTLTTLTAKTISQSINTLGTAYSARELLVGGGGAFNKTLMAFLQSELPSLSISAMNLQGVNQSNKEAFGFAYLGYLFRNNLTGNLPSVTGAREAVVLGKRCESKRLSL